MAELFIDVRDALVVLLRAANTIAGDRVTLGRRIPLANPFSHLLPDCDRWPTCIVSMDGLVPEGNDTRGSRVQYKRVVEYQIDFYETQDRQEAARNNMLVDEYLDSRLDLFVSQAMTVIDAYARFRPERPEVPEPLRLRDAAEMRIAGVKKSEHPNGQSSLLVGAVSVTVEAAYQQQRQFESLKVMEGITQRLLTPGGAIIGE